MAGLCIDIARINLYNIEYGRPVIQPFNEHTVAMFDRIFQLFETSGGAKVALNTDFLNIFSSGKVLFLPCALMNFSGLREMESDIGVIPYPKFDESQANYQSFLNGDVPVTGLPVTCQDPDMASAVLEALCAGAYRNVTMTEIDKVFKGQLSRDTDTAEMIDLILSTSKAELLVMIGPVGNPWYVAVRHMCESVGAKLASIYASGLTQWQTYVDERFDKAVK